MSRAALFWLALLFFVSGGTLIYLGVKNAPAFTSVGTSKPAKTVAYKPSKDKSEWLTEYKLTERSERKIGTEDLAGKVHLVSFFFATCPASCRTQNQHFGDLEREFGKEGVKFVAITCDPETDTPEKLREYANIFNAPKDSWYFLTGDLLYTRRIAGEVYGVALDRKTHVEKFILVDRAGKIRGRYSWADAAELAQLKRDVRTILADDAALTEMEKQQAAEETRRRKELEAEE
jgi:cytochrome oxidase Cu insertion factor (SCO1/SenC/PrrC family)